MPNADILSDDKKRNLFLAGLSGAGILVIGIFLAPERVWSNLLVGTFFLLTTGLGGTVFIALTFVTGARWHVAFLRVPETLAKSVPVAGGAILVVLAARMQHYGWHHHGEGDPGTFWFKELWLTPWFWYLRSIGYVIIWSLLGGWLVARSRKQDNSLSPAILLTGNVRLSALFLVVYALTFSLASVDWTMALDPMWFSTMWGVYNFAGMILAALAVIVIFCILLSAPGRPLHGVFNAEHLHDLGQLFIGFSSFWMYIWFSQYMLIWYANIPEETSYFITRTHGAWAPLVVASIILNWIVPFFTLLPKPAKRSSSVMMKVAVVLLIGRWVDLYIMVFPSTIGETPPFGIWEVATICCVIVAGFTLFDRFFNAEKPLPLNDRFLAENLSHHH